MKLALSGDNPQALNERGTLWAFDPRSGEILALKQPEIRPLATAGLCLLRAADWSAPEQLQALQGCELLYLAQRGSLPRETDEVYYFELVGLEVRTPQGRPVGRVSDVIETGAAVLLELDCQPSVLIPFSARDVPLLDIEAGYLVSSYVGLPREEAL